MDTDYRIATKAVHSDHPFLVDCWIFCRVEGQENAPFMEVSAPDADNALEAEYYGLLSALSRLIESCGDSVREHSLEIIPKSTDIGRQLINRHTIDSLTLYHLREKVFELMSKFKFVFIGWQEP